MGRSVPRSACATCALTSSVTGSAIGMRANSRTSARAYVSVPPERPGNSVNRLNATRTAARSPGSAAEALLRVLAREGSNEARVVAGVAPPQSPRLTGETVRPLKAHALHPTWRLRHDAGVEIECRAHAGKDWRLETIAHLGHPLLLLGLARAHPHDLGTR